MKFAYCVRFAGYCLCILGCTYQVWEVMSQYFSFDTILESHISRPKDFVPPAVSICFPYLQLINYSLAFSESPDFRLLMEAQYSEKNESDNSQAYIPPHLYKGEDFVKRIEKAIKEDYHFREKFYDLINFLFSIRTIMNLSINLDSILEHCVSLVPGAYDLGPCINVSKFPSYVKDDLKCFQFSVDHGDGKSSEYNLQQLYYWQYPDVFLFRFKFKNLDPSIYRIVIYVHPRHRLPAGRTDIPLQIDFPTKKQGYNITFSRTLNILLPEPFYTMCHNYTDSRNQEIDRCIKAETFHRFHKIPPWITLPADSELSTVRRENITDEEFAKFFKPSKECFAKFSKPDCVLEEFKPILLAEKEGSSDGSFGIDVNLPTSLDVVNQLKPAQSGIDLFVYIVSVLGFWFGIYVAGVFRVDHTVKKFLSSRHRERLSVSQQPFFTKKF